MTCRNIIDEFLLDYTQGRLPLVKRARFTFHLALCPSCRAYVRTFQETVRLAKTAAAPPMEQEIPEELVNAILAARAAEG